MEAKDIVLAIDRERMDRRMSQARLAELAGAPDTGQQYARMYLANDAKLSTALRYLHALGWDIKIVKREDMHGE